PKSSAAYAIPQRWFTDISLLPVRNQMAAARIPYFGAFPNESAIHVSLEIPPLPSSRRTFVAKRSFSFARSQRTHSIRLPAPLDEELGSFIRRWFCHCCEIELRRMCGDVRWHWRSNP